MSKFDFYIPQRQSVSGVILIFATSLYKIGKHFWAVGLYFFIMKASEKALFLGGISLAILAVLTLVYSFLYYLKFQFYIHRENDEFILQKGVFSSDVINIPFHKIQHVNFKRNILQRAIGVYSVVIDTAGSGEEEVEIKALSRERADALAELLMEHSSQEKNAEDDQEQQTVETRTNNRTEWAYHLDLLTLLKLGLTTNYLRGLGILVAFYTTLRTQFGMKDEFFDDIPYPAVGEIAVTIIIILALLIIGMLFTVVETVIKYFNLNIKKIGNSLQVEMGLRNNTKINLKASRVQLLQILINPVQRRLNLHKLKISLASSQDSLEKNQIEVPGLPQSIVDKVKEYCFGHQDIPAVQIFRPSKILLFRKMFRSLFFPVLFVIVVKVASIPITDWGMWFIFLLFLILIMAYQFFAFKKIKLFVADDFLIKQSGLWNRKKEIFEMYKLQSVSVVQPIWYKKRELTSINFHSAGGDIRFPLLHEREAKTLMNYLLYKIESTEKPWM